MAVQNRPFLFLDHRVRSLLPSEQLDEEIRNAAPGVVSSSQRVRACTGHGVDGWKGILTLALSFTVHGLVQFAAAYGHIGFVVFIVRPDDPGDAYADRQRNEQQDRQYQYDKTAYAQVVEYDVQSIHIRPIRSMVIKGLNKFYEFVFLFL